MNFRQKLEGSIKRNNSLVCVGLDTDIAKIPKHLLSQKDPIFAFNKAIIDATHDFVCCYKANIAFYLASDVDGLAALKMTADYLKEQYSDIPLILDGKWTDIGNTSYAYAKVVFDVIKADAATVNPYQGSDALKPFLDRKEKGVIVLCRTSNAGASEIQHLKVDGKPLYQVIARKVARDWNTNKNAMLVVGASSQEIGAVREIVGDMFLLVPGVGVQRGDLRKTVEGGLNQKKSGLIMHSARSIIYADSSEQFAEVARQKAEELRVQINQYR